MAEGNISATSGSLTKKTRGKSVPSVEMTIEFVKLLHRDQTDRLGVPYWKHLVSVMTLMGSSASDSEKLVALLHDSIEDGHANVTTLWQLGFPLEVVRTVFTLTRGATDANYYEYIHRIIDSGNESAMRVKLADLTDNLDPARPIPSSLRKRYVMAKAMIENALLDDRLVRYKI